MKPCTGGGALVLAVLLLPGCGLVARRPAPVSVAPAFTEEAFARKAIPSFRLRTPAPGEEPAETMIGAVGTHRIRAGDTLMDVARWYDLGYQEIVDANPGVDPWVPAVGTSIVVPTEWVLPCCTYDGIVLNIPEMRLYLYERAPGNPRTTIVRTYPVGLGRRDRRTPRGTFRVRDKTVDPRWVIPEPIRREHIRERGDARTSIAGGAPDNPLGHYRLSLTLAPYSIHGTDIPWGVGMEVSHGCARLYPEDIERLFPLVAVGTPVAFVYQPVKVGSRGGRHYVEGHRDIYGYGDGLAALARRTAHLDVGRVRDVVRQSRGVPLELGSGRR